MLINVSENIPLFKPKIVRTRENFAAPLSLQGWRLVRGSLGAGLLADGEALGAGLEAGCTRCRVTWCFGVGFVSVLRGLRLSVWSEMMAAWMLCGECLLYCCISFEHKKPPTAPDHILLIKTLSSR